MSDVKEPGPVLAYRHSPASRPEAETIMLLHGNGFNSSLWGGMAERLNECFHVLFIDVHAGEAEYATWDRLCGELRGLLARLDIRELHIAGHAFGGSLAVAFADRYPEAVKTLVLISLAVFYPAVEGERIINAYLGHIAEQGLPTVARREFIPFLTLLPEGDEMLEAIYRAYDRIDERLYLQLFKLQMLDRPIHERRKIACPALLLAGEQDKLYLPQLQSITAGYFARGSFLIMPNASNAVFIDQPELTAQWIRDFVLKASNYVRQSSRATMASHIPSIIHAVMQNLAPDMRPRESAKALEPVLHVALFHPFEVRLNGVPILDGWDKRYAKTIMAYLAMHPSCTREELCDALFPELSRLTALSNLRVYLGYLKKLLELPGGESVLVTSRTHIRLNAKIECDLQIYGAELRRIPFITDGESKYAALRALLRTVGTEPFMQGIYDQWFLDFRTDIEELLASLSEWAASWEARMDRPDSARYFAQIAHRLTDGGDSL
ncbi:alpha/beta fold hydrolase [Paenibacillus sp. MWE-103]|uniref:Alpha/beta fold hydrolase n=1 Tax=Paenibacillus artemisiicola TaxID=1172618 RepID=A0ABS3W8S2_9BACL|nr:alpha/beta hydrolase [Paenibacillus artemisiicola]MBO7744707.1 alpha/beta fold hydrolase [Paenibacillus artemisiicola]